MKVFRKEGSKEVVYVQLQDLMHLYDSDMYLLPSIYLKVQEYGKFLNPNLNNPYSFIIFDQEDEIALFKNIEFVLDYDEYSKLPLDEVENIKQHLLKASEELVSLFKITPIENIAQRANLADKNANIQYMIYFIDVIIDAKMGKRNIPYPTFINT